MQCDIGTGMVYVTRLKEIFVAIVIYPPNVTHLFVPHMVNYTRPGAQ